jgi:hypothetical protein
MQAVLLINAASSGHCSMENSAGLTSRWHDWGLGFGFLLHAKAKPKSFFLVPYNLFPQSITDLFKKKNHQRSSQTRLPLILTAVSKATFTPSWVRALVEENVTFNSLANAYPSSSVTNSPGSLVVYKSTMNKLRTP